MAASAATYPLWDGKESVAEYAARAGIRHTEIVLELGPKTQLKLTLIPAGRFVRGEPDKHWEVTLTRPFYLSTTEVSQEQFEAVMATNPSRVARSPEYPVDDVTWDEAMRFCEKLSQKTGRAIAPPTEAQWEHAYRAGTTTVYFTGDDEASIRDYAWYAKTTDGSTATAKTMKVGTRKPNPWGLYDMAGNINEWCLDFFDLQTYASERVDPVGPKTGKIHVIKGGSVMQVTWIKPTFRRGVAPNYRFGMEASPMIIGFRVVAALN